MRQNRFLLQRHLVLKYPAQGHVAQYAVSLQIVPVDGIHNRFLAAVLPEPALLCCLSFSPLRSGSN